jgi:hypothetical protein
MDIPNIESILLSNDPGVPDMMCIQNMAEKLYRSFANRIVLFYKDF